MLTCAKFSAKNFGEVLNLATSSITHNFIISDEEAIGRFIRAIEESEMERETHKETHSGNVKLAVSEQENLALTEKWHSKHREYQK